MRRLDLPQLCPQMSNLEICRITGIGGLGKLTIQYANKFGCHVITFLRSSSKNKETREFGAYQFVNTSNAKKLKNAQKSGNFLLSTGTLLNINNKAEYT